MCRYVKHIYGYISDHPEVSWYCSADCQSTVLKLIKSDQEIEERCNAYLAGVEKRIVNIEEKLETKIDKAQFDELAAKQTALEEMFKTHTNGIRTVNEKLDMIRNEPGEKIKREKNVVIRSLPEDGRDDEITKCILDSIGCGDIGFRTTQRLGRPLTEEQVLVDPETNVARPRARPLRVVLNSTEDKSKILSNAPKIRKSKIEKLDSSRIFIVPDQTKLQRKDEMALRQRLSDTKSKKPRKDFQNFKGENYRSEHRPPSPQKSGAQGSSEFLNENSEENCKFSRCTYLHKNKEFIPLKMHYFTFQNASFILL